MTDFNNFQQILTCLLSDKNIERTNAENAYESIGPIEKAMYLVQTLHPDNVCGVSEKQMACVLMRRLIVNHFEEFYPRLSPEDQNNLKECLLLALQSDTMEKSVQRKLCDAVSELARCLIDEEGNNSWKSFLEFLFQSAKSSSSKIRECALRMFSNFPGVFGSQEHMYVDTIKQMLKECVTDQSSAPVRMQAVKAICSFIIHHEEDLTIQKHFQDLLQNMVAVLSECSDTYEDEENVSVMRVFIDMCETAPKFLRPQLGNVIQLCLRMTANEDLEDFSRHLMLEAIVTLCESAAPMMRKESASYVGLLLTTVLHMMTELEDDEEWNHADVIIEDDNDSNHVIAESSIDRIACGLGGKTVLPHIVQTIPQMLHHADWKYRHAALMAISAVGEGCQKQMEPMLGDILNLVIRYLEDEHPRVRYAACNAIGQMSSDFSPALQKEFHDKLIPALLKALDDNANPRVQAHAGAAMVNFCEDCPKAILILYLHDIMAKLEAILKAKFSELVQNGTKLVLEQIVTTIASVADTVEAAFTPYYDSLMPCLKFLIQNAKTPDMRLLRGKTLESVSLIGIAVGPKKFMEDAKDVMDTLLKNHEEESLLVKKPTNGSVDSDVEGADPITDESDYNTYLISAWARICIVLGKKFEPYLPLVIGPVMRMASMKPEVALLDSDEVGDMDDDNWQFVNLGEQQSFGIHTAGLEDKTSACEMLVCYARELKEGFAPYAEETLRLMVPMLKFYFHDGVRIAAAQSLAPLLASLRCKGPQVVTDAWNYVCPELLQAISKDPEYEVIGDLYAALAKCVEELGEGCLTAEWMETLMALLEKSIREHFEEQQAILAKRQDEDYDEILEEEIANENSDTTYKISKISDVMHTLFKIYGVEFLPYFDRLLPHFATMLGVDRKWTDHQWALCVFDDLIEFTGPKCADYSEYFLAPMAKYLDSKHPEVRQACCYGWGILAVNGGPAFASTCVNALEKLSELIGRSDSRSQENLIATENAISAFTKTMKYHSEHLQVDSLIPMWFNWLPVCEDADEVPYVYDYLCTLIESGHPYVTDNARVHQLINALIAPFVSETIEYEHLVAQRIIAIVKRAASNDSFLAACSALTSQQKLALQELITYKRKSEDAEGSS